MSNFNIVLRKQQQRELAAIGEAMADAKWIFTEWRNRFCSALCAYMRTYKQAEIHKVKLPPPYKPMIWCSAAVHILSVCGDEIQDTFLRGDEKLKDAMCQAVIDDDGVEDVMGRFVELPAL